jgi:hypothetical protein
MTTGRVAELQVAARFLEHGYQVYAPLVDDAGIDLIVRRPSGPFHEIQIKRARGDRWFQVTARADQDSCQRWNRWIVCVDDQDSWLIPARVFFDPANCTCSTDKAGLSTYDLNLDTGKPIRRGDRLQVFRNNWELDAESIAAPLLTSPGGSGIPSAWTDLFRDVALCKAAHTCSRLGVRSLFFEPNPQTIEVWRSQRGFYREGIDRRVVFVCESPSDRQPTGSPGAFSVEQVEGLVCWNYTAQDGKFRDIRVKHGFQHCYITNVVKCGKPRPSTPADLTEEEARACAQFLVRELEMIRPAVIAFMGGEALRIAQRHVLPHLSFGPAPVRLTHYSARERTEELFARWDSEFEQVRSALRARGLPTDSPVWAGDSR